VTLSIAWVATSDVLLAGYPILVFWNLKISTRVKAGLCLLMAGSLLLVSYIASLICVVKAHECLFLEPLCWRYQDRIYQADRC